MRAFCGALEMRVACSLFGSGNAQVITPVAGTDFHFASGSLAAVDALLDRPSGAAVAAGSVFVADEFNQCTRARDHLLVTGVSPVSEFLDDLVDRRKARQTAR
jgi:hypothetical protein